MISQLIVLYVILLEITTRIDFGGPIKAYGSSAADPVSVIQKSPRKQSEIMIYENKARKIYENVYEN